MGGPTLRLDSHIMICYSGAFSVHGGPDTLPEQCLVLVVRVNLSESSVCPEEQPLSREDEEILINNFDNMYHIQWNTLICDSESGGYGSGVLD